MRFSLNLLLLLLLSWAFIAKLVFYLNALLNRRIREWLGQWDFWREMVLPELVALTAILACMVWCWRRHRNMLR